MQYERRPSKKPTAFERYITFVLFTCHTINDVSSTETRRAMLHHEAADEYRRAYNVGLPKAYQMVRADLDKVLRCDQSNGFAPIAMPSEKWRGQNRNNYCTHDISGVR